MVNRVLSRVAIMNYTYTIKDLYYSDLMIEENETGRWILLSTLKKDASLIIEDKELSVYRIYQYVLQYHPEFLL